jgi:para-aminobenzoate synthetase component 2
VVLLIDNYDSFVHNLARYVRELGETTAVYRNDAITLAEITALAPSHIIISPGPCTPREAGISNDVIVSFGSRVPILGVCLGHQAIGAAFGARVVRADRLMHGKTCEVIHEADELFEGIPSPVTGMRYHSLVVEPASLPKDLVITAWSADRPKEAEIMAMKHRRHPIYGVQFHPESIGTSHGRQLLENFLRIAHATV